VTLAADGVTPLAFFVGVGRASYDDSASWAQLFCAEKHSAACGPTLPPAPPPPPPPVRLRHAPTGGCLTFDAAALAAGRAPCWLGENWGCAVTLGDCAANASLWTLDAASGGVFSAATLPAAAPALALNFDCNARAPRTPVWAFGPPAGGNAQPLALVGGTLRAPGADACVAAGAAEPPRAPCGPQQRGFDLARAAQVASCADAAAQGWTAE